jgi:hypothetical protein
MMPARGEVEVLAHELLEAVEVEREVPNVSTRIEIGSATPIA